MIGSCRFAVYRFVAYRFVTARLGPTTHCHHSLGYYCGKYLISFVDMSDGSGTRYATEGKVVNSR
jgi:hypothetical protein